MAWPEWPRSSRWLDRRCTGSGRNSNCPSPRPRSGAPERPTPTPTSFGRSATFWPNRRSTARDTERPGRDCAGKAFARASVGSSSLACCASSLGSRLELDQRLPPPLNCGLLVEVILAKLPRERRAEPLPEDGQPRVERVEVPLEDLRGHSLLCVRTVRRADLLPGREQAVEELHDALEHLHLVLLRVPPLVGARVPMRRRFRPGEGFLPPLLPRAALLVHLPPVLRH